MKTIPTLAGRQVSDRMLFLSVTTLIFVAVFATADRSLPYDIDPFMNAASAEALASTGSPILTGLEAFATPDARGVFGWVVTSERGPVSQYPPGTALFASPFYLLDRGTQPALMSATNDPDAPPLKIEVPALWPASLAGSVAVALAGGFMSLAVRRATDSWEFGAGAAILLAAGTGLWLNGGYQLWQHGISSMWIPLALWLTADGRWLGSGFAMSLAILTRPPVAIIAAFVGVAASLHRRSIRPALLHGTAALLGLTALLAYNYWLFGELTISGGYSTAFTDNFMQNELAWYVGNILGGLFSPERGLFVWSPFLLVALFGVRGAWRQSPAWASAAALGGLVLLLIQFRANRYSGGSGFFSYRYPLETLTAATPLLALSVQRLVRNQLGRRAFVFTAVAAIGLHAAALIDELWRG